MSARPVTCPTLIGRDSHLETLTELRRGLSRSRAAFVLIGGEAGIGKSRLLAHFMRALGDGRPRTIAQVDCFEHAPLPLGPLRDVLVRLAATTRAPLPDLWARFVARDSGDVPFEKAELFHAAVEFLRERARERATVVTIEDLHWADATTLEFLAYAAGRLHTTRLLVLATYRSEDVERRAALRTAIARMMREPAAVRLHLAALSQADTRRLLHGALDGRASIAPDVIAEIASRSEGNAFFAEELLKAALERTNARKNDLPISIRESIVERLRTFTPDERRTIEAASVLGVRFDPDVLARMMKVALDAIVPALRLARDANLIVEEDGERVWFRFRHALTRQAIYDDLLLFDARRTHRGIVATLEALDAGDRYLEELAYHSWEARDAGRTLRYNERAADVALSLASLPQARAGYERALGVAHDVRDRARILERLARVESRLGDGPRAIEVAERGIAAALEIDDVDAAARLVRASAADRNNAGDERAVAFGRAFLATHGARVSAGARAELCALLGRLAVISYDIAGAVELIEEAGDERELVESAAYNVLVTRADIAWCLGDRSAWIAAAESIVDLLPRLDPFLSAIASYALVQAAAYHARDDLSERALRQIDHLATRAEFPVLRTYGAACRALDAFVRGDVVSAAEYVRGISIEGDGDVAIGALATFAPLLIAACGDQSPWRETLASSLEQFARQKRANARHPDDGVVLGANAVGLLRLGRTTAALRDLRVALRVLERPVVHATDLLATAAEHLPLAELDVLERFTSGARHVGDPLLRAQALTTSAIVARRRNDVVRAREQGSEAAELYRSLARPMLEARALVNAGRTQDADSLYRACGALGFVQHIDTATGSLFDVLSAREREVAQLAADGLGNGVIAERLSISTKTVEKHIGAVYAKLNLHSRQELANAHATRSRSALRGRDTSDLPARHGMP